MRVKHLVAPVAVTALLGIFLWMVGGRVAAMFSTGKPVMIAIGAGILMILVAILYGMFREWLLALTVSKMSEQLHDEGKLVHDDLEGKIQT